MNTNADNLKRLIDLIKTMGFWQRLFNWRKVKQLLVDAVADSQRIITAADSCKEYCNELKNDNSRLHLELQLSKTNAAQHARQLEELRQIIDGSNQKIIELTAAISANEQTLQNRKNNFYELEKEHFNLKKDFQFSHQQLDELKRQNTQLITDEAARKQELEKALSTLEKIQSDVTTCRHNEIEERHIAELRRLEGLKRTWANHQLSVKQAIKSICNRHTIEYVENVPFKGDPDNTLKICNEHIIFDAKSPQGEDLTN